MYCVICDKDFDDALRDCPHCDEGSSAPLCSAFDLWWHNVGSGITPKKGDDLEEHTRKVAAAAWDKAANPWREAARRKVFDHYLLEWVDPDSLPNAEVCQLEGENNL